MSLCRHASTTIGLAVCFEASRAEDWAATLFHWTWLEGNLTLRTALGAHGIVHLTVAEALRFALIAAGLAALWSAQVPALVELLFTVSEREGLAAIAAL